jgi:hypothetical protein
MSEPTEYMNGPLREVMIRLLGAVAALVESDRDDVQTLSLLACTRRAADLMGGASLVAHKKSLDALAVLDRALWETMLYARWVFQSEDNAKRFREFGRAQLKKLMVKNLKAGTARITHMVTGEDVTEEFLRHPGLQDLDRPGDWQNMADAVGAGKAHRALYGMMAMLAHGSYGDLTFPVDDWLDSTILATGAVGNHIADVASAWLQGHDLPPAPDPFSE